MSNKINLVYKKSGVEREMILMIGRTDAGWPIEIKDIITGTQYFYRICYRFWFHYSMEHFQYT